MMLDRLSSCNLTARTRNREFESHMDDYGVNQDLINLVRVGSQRAEAGPQNVVRNATRPGWDQP
jgi:hypothetical protein